MKHLKTISSIILLLAPLSAFGQKRETIELQRDVAALQDQVRALQRTIDEKLAALQTQAQQTFDTVTKSNTSVAVLESKINDRLSEVSRTLANPVANLNAKLDQMTGDFQAVRGGVEDLTARMNKLQAQLVDINNAVSLMRQPVAPPAAGGPVGSAGAPATGTAVPPAGMSASQVYDAARRDMSGGNLDLAMQGFTEYLKYFDNTDLAPNAQFYIGQIYYNKSDFPSAIKAFDLVLEHYPENTKTPDATYMKGMALLKSGQRTEAGKEFLDVIQKYPKSEVAPKARDQRKALGLSVPSASASASTRKKKR